MVPVKSCEGFSQTPAEGEVFPHWVYVNIAATFHLPVQRKQLCTGTGYSTTNTPLIHNDIPVYLHLDTTCRCALQCPTCPRVLVGVCDSLPRPYSVPLPNILGRVSDLEHPRARHMVGLGSNGVHNLRKISLCQTL
jgi:hypothetical protein